MSATAIDASPRSASNTEEPARARKRWGPPRFSDVLLPVALATWLVALSGAHLDSVNDWGLLPALPVLFYVALGILIVSIACTLTDSELSPARLALHLTALVFVLHGTVPLLFPAPNYPWVYKHIGVVGYINLHGQVDPSVDIYQNWPGFFSVAAFFTRIAGVGSPIEFAKWAPVYFNLIYCLELAFVLRALPLSRRTRWLASFLFVAANWVGQDYFAPQALAFGLCLAVYGIVLTWMQVDRQPAPVKAAGRLVRRMLRAPEGVPGDAPVPPAPLSGWARSLVFGALITVFAVVVVSHQLSPFLVLFGIGTLAASGVVRPRWVLVVMGAIAIAYLAGHLTYLRSEGHLAGSPFNPRELIGALSNPFDNAHSTGFNTANPMPGRSITALASPVMILGLWVFAAVGTVRRFRSGGRVLLLVLLAASPAFLVVGQNYGGEAIFRIFLFSLPWTVTLGACALAPRSDRWHRGSAVTVGLTLAVVVALFMSAFYGSIELYRVRPGAIAASEYFFDHARPGSVLGLVAPNVPGRVSPRYDKFTAGSTPPPLSTVEAFQHHLLGPGDVYPLSRLYGQHIKDTPGNLYLSLSSDQQVYAEVLGLMPSGSLDSLDRALAASPWWRVFYRNGDAVIYRFLPD